MKQGTKRLLSMAGALAMIVGAFVVYFELTQPAYRDLEMAQGKRQGREKFLAEQKPAVDKVQALIAEYTGEGAGDLKQALSESLPLGPNPSAPLVQLEGLVRASGLSIQTLTPQPNRASAVPSVGGLVKPVGTLTFKVSFVGSYEQMKDFFSKMESNVLLFEVRSLNIQPSGKAGFNSFNGNVEIVSYYQQS